MRRPACLFRPFAVVVTASAILLTSSPAFAAPSANGDLLSGAKAAAKSDIKSKKKPEIDELRERLADVADAYKKGEDKVGAIEKRSKRVTKQVAATKARLARTRERVAQIAQVTYISGGVDSSALALTGEGGPDVVAERMTAMSVLAEADDATLRDAVRDRRRLNRQLADLNEVKRQAKAEQAKLKAQRDKLNAALREAAKLAAERRADRATRSRPTGQFVCPVGNPYTMMNTFGAPRSGGRSHEGTDIAAPGCGGWPQGRSRPRPRR